MLIAVTDLTSICIVKVGVLCLSISANQSFLLSMTFNISSFKGISFRILMFLRLYLLYTNRMQENISFPASYFSHFLLRTSGKLQSKLGRWDLAGGHHGGSSQYEAAFRLFGCRYAISQPVSEALLQATLMEALGRTMSVALPSVSSPGYLDQTNRTVCHNNSFDNIYCRSCLLSKVLLCLNGFPIYVIIHYKRLSSSSSSSSSSS